MISAPIPKIIQALPNIKEHGKGNSKNSRENFTYIPESFINPEVSQRLLQVLESKIKPHLTHMQSRIDPKITRNQRFNYAEKLNKTVSSRTLRYSSPKEISLWKMAQIHNIIKPEIARQLCEAIYGIKLNKAHGSQIVANYHGDYAGPHNDHHPELPNLRRGYIDFHFYVCNPFVESQLFVQEDKGHFNQVLSLANPCGINIYKLPFWHYTTPLQGKVPNQKKAVRWIVMYTFDYAGR